MIIWETTRILVNVLVASFVTTFHDPVLCSNKHPGNEEFAFKSGVL